jgi:K+-transporting ATPase c subunit
MLTQVQAARIMAAHEKAVAAELDLCRVTAQTSSWQIAKRAKARGIAKQAFTDLIATLVEPE